MISLMWLRVAGVAGLLAALYGGYQYIQHTGVVQGRAEVQKKFDDYKENINDQVEKAKADAAKVKLEQDAKFAKSQTDYAADRARLVAILNGLRKSETVPGNQSLPVAEPRIDSMPADTADTSRVVEAPAVTAGACEGTEFYALAMLDTLQCSRLIEFVTP